MADEINLNEEEEQALERAWEKLSKKWAEETQSEDEDDANSRSN